MTFQVSKVLPATLLKAIGRVAVEWSQVEYWLMVAVVDLADLKDPYGRILVTHMALTPQIEGLLACAKERRREPKADDMDFENLGDEEYAELLALVREVERLRPLRNEIVHAFWMGTEGKRPKKATHYKATARREFKVTYLHKSAAEVEKVADDIGKLSQDVYEWCLGRRGAELTM